MQQWYSCPQCRQYVQHGQPNCQYCGCRFNWPAAPKAENMGPFSKHWWIHSPVPKIVIGVLFFWVMVAIVYNSTSKSSPPTSQTELTSSEATYASAASDSADKIGTAIGDITDLLEDPEGSAAWQVKVGARLGALQYWIKEARKMTPPASMQSIHSKYMEGLDHYYQFADYMDLAVKTVDQTYVTKAMTEFKAGTTCINETTEMLSEFKTSREK